MNLFHLSVICIVLFASESAYAFGFKNCIKIDNDFYHNIIDPDIIEIGNDKLWSISSASCNWQERRLPFSNCANGCPIVPNSAVRFEKDITEICEGDPIYVYNYKCKIDSMKPEQY